MSRHLHAGTFSAASLPLSTQRRLALPPYPILSLETQGCRCTHTSGPLQRPDHRPSAYASISTCCLAASSSRLGREGGCLAISAAALAGVLLASCHPCRAIPPRHPPPPRPTLRRPAIPPAPNAAAVLAAATLARAATPTQTRPTPFQPPPAQQRRSSSNLHHPSCRPRHLAEHLSLRGRRSALLRPTELTPRPGYSAAPGRLPLSDRDATQAAAAATTARARCPRTSRATRCCASPRFSLPSTQAQARHGRATWRHSSTPLL